MALALPAPRPQSTPTAQTSTRPTRDSLREIGLILPTLHLGSFSGMTFEPKFNGNRVYNANDDAAELGGDEDDDGAEQVFADSADIPTPELKVVNGQYIRRIESVDYAPPAAQPQQPYTLPAQFVQSPAPPQEEVCLECMMRDRDMAGVDVTGPGVWARESDVWYEELVRREEEEARDGYNNDPRRKTKNTQPSSQGGQLTEGNIAIWLSMNPKEPAARWQTLEKYIAGQAAVLAAENSARAQTLRESRAEEERVRNAYAHVKRAGEPSSSSGVKLRASTTPVAFPYDEQYTQQSPAQQHQVYGYDSPSTERSRRKSNASTRRDRDVTLLESGLIMERVDIKREERDARKDERRRSRKTSRVSTVAGQQQQTVSGGFTQSDAESLHSLSAPMQGVNYGGSRSQISLSLPPRSPGGPDSPGGAGSSNKRMSSPMALTLTPPRLSMARGASHSSTESRGTTPVVPHTPSPRFRGFRHWSGAFGSEVSLHNNSGSMMDMHLGLEQDREMYINGGMNEDEQWLAQSPVEFGQLTSQAAFEDQRTKRSSIGRLWKKMTTSKEKRTHRQQQRHLSPPQDDLNAPLDPPPPLSFLVSRSRASSSAHHERASGPPAGRHVSVPHSNNNVGSIHPRTLSLPVPSQFIGGLNDNGNMSSLSSPTSPADSRYPPSSSDEPRFSRPSINIEDKQNGPIAEDGIYDMRGVSNTLPHIRHSATAPQMQQSRNSQGDGYSWRGSPTSNTLPARPPSWHHRRMSTASIDKALPPLPPPGAYDPHFPPTRNSPGLRPLTSYEILSHPPNAPFKGADTRRLSFNGPTGRASFSGHTVHGPIYGKQSYGGAVHSSPTIDEFGGSTQSLGRWMSRTTEEQARGTTPTMTTYAPAKDRRSSRRQSRFSSRLSAMFGGGNNSSGSGEGRRSEERQNQLKQTALNGNGLAPSDGERYPRQGENFVGYGYALPPAAGGGSIRGSRSSLGLVPDPAASSSRVSFPRLSIVSSSRRYEGVIPQERDFIAMRYPTESERLDLMRRS